MRKTIIFDVDGTLLETERIYTDSWVIAGTRFGYEITRDMMLRTRGYSVEATRNLLRDLFGEEFPFEAVREARIEASEEEIRKKTAEELLKPFVKETLKSLDKLGYRFAVATSTGAEMTKDHLVRAGIFHYFSAIVSGEMVQFGKPHPEIFLKAAELAGAKPEDCIAVGDSPADVLSAHNAGMEVILVPDLAKNDEKTRSLCFKVLDSFEHVTDAIEEINHPKNKRCKK